MLFGLIPLIIFGGIIVLIVRAVAGRNDDDEEAGSNAVRRFFQYTLLLSVLVVVAIGASGLLAEIIPGENLIRRSPDQNARAFAFLIVGGPALYGLTRWIRRDLVTERSSFAWAFYLAIASLTALITAAIGLFEVGLALVRTDDFRPNALSQFIVWGAVWYIHHRISQDPQQDSKRLRLYRASGSLVGLFTVALATAFVLTIALSAVYSSLFDTVAIDAGSERLREGLVGLTVGLLIWWRYWLSSYAHADRDVVWHGYGLLTGVLPGLITLLTGLTMLVFWILDWLRDSGGSAAEHFELTPNALAAIGVGTLLWAYHRAVLRTSAADERTEIDRVYDYLVSAVGLLAAASGVATVLVAVVQGLVPGDASSGAGNEASVLMGAIALLIVGLPVWWRSWSKIQRIRAAQPEAELVSASRRIYLFALFGVGGVAALISLLTLGVQVLEDLFSGRLGSETLFSIRISIALVITVGAIAAYHWIVRREDQDDMPAAEERLVLVRSIVLVSANGPDIASEIERRTGVRVRTWDRPDSDVDVATDDVVEAIEQGEHSRLLLIARPGQVEAIPYRELR